MHQVDNPLEGQTSLKAAMEQTWDGSDEHAEALAKLILASRDLWPKMRKE